MSYEDRPKDLAQDAKAFLDSEYGKYVMDILDQKAEGHLARADDMETPYPERYLAKHSAVKEVIDLLNSPIG